MRSTLWGVMLLMMGCHTSPKTPDLQENEAFDKTSNRENAEYAAVDPVELNQHFSEMQLAGVLNIGEFFDHRLKFYKVDRPDLRICGSTVNKLVLYFIDSTLVRLRYDVDTNVSNNLLDSLGLSKFKPLDSISKHLLKSRKVYNKIKGKLDEKLSNYELVWYKGDAVSRFRVRDRAGDSTDSFLFYTEMLGYKEKRRELEAHYNYLEASLSDDY